MQSSIAKHGRINTMQLRWVHTHKTGIDNQKNSILVAGVWVPQGYIITSSGSTGHGELAYYLNTQTAPGGQAGNDANGNDRP
jgi:hypothetical protein